MKNFLRIAFVALFTAISYFSLPAAIVGIAAAILVALQDKASTLIEVSFGPLKAKLQKDVTEAERLVAELRKLGVIQARSVIQAGVRTGRFSQVSDWLYVMTKQIESALTALGVAKEEISDARTELVRYTVFDAAHAALGRGRVPSSLGQGAIDEWKKLMDKGFDITPDDVEAYLTKWGALSTERSLLVADMRWMIENNDIRDREQYLRAQNSVEWGN